MTAYYNEFDPKAASWLRQLIKNGDIADGTVDERSIIEVEATDLEGFTQHHFFAGVGVWSYALRNAGWGDDRPVCTASLPCQPFSAAGNQKGKEDERHLLPHFLELVGQCNFHTIFGEQVETAIKHGWLDDLYTEMERENYTVGSAIIGAHSIGKPHIRKRIYWVAQCRMGNTDSERLQEHREPGELHIRESDRQNQERLNLNTGLSDRVANTNGEQCEQGLQPLSGGQAERHRSNSEHSRMANTNDAQRGAGQESEQSTRSEQRQSVSDSGMDGRRSGSESSTDGRMVNPISDQHRCSERGVDGETNRAEISDRTEVTQSGQLIGTSEYVRERPSADSIEWLYCRDEKYRPIKSGIEPLVDGIARGVVHSCDSVITPNASAEARTIRLKGYGNAIVAPVAEEFIRATMDVIDE
jgi:DNA (cytosine-5)-methyltransferase 1